MLEQKIFDVITTDIGLATYVGKAPTSIDYTSPVCVIIKLPSLVNATMPLRVDTLQLTVRSLYVDSVDEEITKLINLFQGWYDDYDTGRVWVVGVANLGIVYEEEDIVAGILSVSFKYVNQ